MLDALRTVAQSYYTITYENPVEDEGWGWLATAGFIALVVAIIMIASYWRIFTKAGRKGWSALVPFLNTFQLIWTAGKPWWWFLLFLIPFVNIVVAVMLAYNLAKAFGKGVGYTLLLIFLPIIGFPMLAWGSATYKLKKSKNGF